MLRPVTRTCGALLSAVLLSLCYPSGWLAWLAWFALVPFILSVEEEALPVAFWRGYAAGFIFFILTLFWIHHVTALGLVLLALYLALYWGAFAAAVAWSASWSLGRRVLFIAAVWTALEFIRAHAFTGFGWSALAHTQSVFYQLIQIADITGAYGISFLMVAVSVLLAAAAAASLSRCQHLPPVFWRIATRLGLAIIIVMVYGMFSMPVKQRRDARVALVQANISLADYQDPLLKSYVVDKHLALSLQAMAQTPELIIWPETAFPQFIWDYPELFEKVRDFARAHKVKMLLGAVTKLGEDYYNSALFIDENGALPRVYSKQHLVVLGEYIPFRKQVPLLGRFVPIDDFTSGSGNVLFPFKGGLSFAPLICFEDTIPALARVAVRQGAGLLVNMTNDAWFAASRQSRMHLDSAVFRAVENHVSLVRATNTGMSCAIAATGEIYGCLPTDAAGVSVVDVALATPEASFYTKYGDVFALLCFPGILGLFVFKRREEKNVRPSACLQDPHH